MFDIENFPTNETAIEMMEMVSPIYENSYVGKWIYQIMGFAMGMAISAIQGMEQEAFPETASKTLAMWEDMYGIVTNTALSDEERRQAIVLKRNYRKPMNPARIAAMVTDITGRDAFVRENTAPHEFEVCISPGTSEAVLDAVRSEIEKVQQAKIVHIVFEADVGVAIRPQPRRVKYDYEMTSTLRKTGTRPERSTIAHLEDVSLAVSPKKTEAVYPYPLTGTVPDRSSIGQMERTTIEVSPEESRQTYPYVMAGKKPDVSGIGVAQRPGVPVSVKKETYGVVYKMCGSKKL